MRSDREIWPTKVSDFVSLRRPYRHYVASVFLIPALVAGCSHLPEATGGRAYDEQAVGWVDSETVMVLRKSRSLEVKTACAVTGLYTRTVSSETMAAAKPVLTGGHRCAILTSIDHTEFNPSNNKLLYTGADVDVAERIVGVLDLANDDHNIIRHACARGIHDMTWLDSQHFAILTTCHPDSGEFKIVVLNLTGEETSIIPLPSRPYESYGAIDWSEANSKFLLSIGTALDASQRRIVTVEPGEGDILEVVSPGLMPVWKPNSTQIAYVVLGEQPSNEHCIVVQHLRGDTAEVLPVGPSSVCGKINGPLHWSPDGRYLAFSYPMGLLGLCSGVAVLEVESSRVICDAEQTSQAASVRRWRSRAWSTATA